MTWLALVVDGLAVYRLTRLATADALTMGPRERIIRWAYWGHHGWTLRARPPFEALPMGDPGEVEDRAIDDGLRAPKLAQLIICRWCAGVWVAAGVTAARWCAPVLWGPPSWGLAVSCAGPLLARLEE